RTATCGSACTRPASATASSGAGSRATTATRTTSAWTRSPAPRPSRPGPRRGKLAPMRQIILDTETTGLEWKKGNRVVEIGCVELLERRPSGRNFHRYLKPDCEFEAGA